MGEIEVAKGISEYGILIVMAAFFLTLSAATFRWFKSVINNIINNTDKNFKELLNETKNQNIMLAEISEGLRPETLLKTKSISSVFFDLGIEKVCRMIRKVRTENHIADKENTVKKINTLLTNIHDDRNSKFDNYTYRGRKLSSYTSSDWIQWVQDVVVSEVYAESENNGRAYTNVNAVYERIKIDFYHRLTQL